MCSLEWSSSYPKAIGLLDAAIGSDHAPILILPQGLKKKYKKEFEFQSKWLLEEECTSIVQKSWAPISQPRNSHRFGSKLRRTKYSLIKWSKLKSQVDNHKKLELLNKIKSLQGKQMSKHELSEFNICKKELDKMWESEERYWHQRARINWLQFGDKNTKFFHATTLQHRRMNSICRIKKENGEWIVEPKEMAIYFQHHFQEIYAKDMSINFHLLEDLIPSVITEDMNEFFSKVVSEEEIKNVVFSMGSSKAPGPDGFPGSFYHSFWDIIKVDLIAMVSHFFNFGFLDYELNKTNIVLIPKVKNPCEAHHFRPISLCNFSMKVITKILASRLKRFLPDIISPSQSTFVNGRLFQDNIIIAHEAFHAIKRAKKGSKGVMALKIDMEKAYDEVDWDLLRNSETSTMDVLLLLSCYGLCRNHAMVFEGLLESPWDVWNRAECAFKEFSNAISKSHISDSSSQSEPVTWYPPPMGIIKVSCDAAFDKLTGKAVAAAVARDFSGSIIQGDTSRLNSGVLSAWESAAVEEDILSMTSLFSSFSFSFIPRVCNRAADWVAKNVLNVSCPMDWVNNVPPGLLSFL
ncbi:hypothetical protein GQ457_06G003800 [Hibiscus cannabinus]